MIGQSERLNIDSIAGVGTYTFSSLSPSLPLSPPSSRPYVSIVYKDNRYKGNL